MKNACAKQASFDQTSVSVPWQYRCDPNRTGTAAVGQMAFFSKSLDEELFDDGGSLHDVLASSGVPADAMLVSKKKLELAKSLCVGNQLAMLDGLIAGKSLSDVATERGVSRSKISLEYVALKGKMAKLGKPAKRIKRKRRMELTRALLMKAFAGFSSLNENQLTLALRKLGFKVRPEDAKARFNETGLLVWQDGEPGKRIKGVYRLATANSIRAKKPVRLFDIPCHACGIVVQRKHNRSQALCEACEKKQKSEWSKARYLARKASS